MDFIKNIIADIQYIKKSVTTLVSILAHKEEISDKQKMIDIYRLSLGSITIDEIQKNIASTSERKQYTATISGAYKSGIEDVIDTAIREQINYMIHHPGGMTDFSIGTLNGFELIKEKLDNIHNEHISYATEVKEEDDSDVLTIQYTEPKVVDDNNQSAL